MLAHVLADILCTMQTVIDTSRCFICLWICCEFYHCDCWRLWSVCD